MSREYKDERRRANTDPSLHYNQHVSDECTYQDHDLCRDDKRCACPHHYMVQLKLEHQPLRSLADVESEREEAVA